MKSKCTRTKHNKSFLSLNNSLIKDRNFDKVRVNQITRNLISLTDMAVNLSIRNLCIDITEDRMHSITDDCYRIAYYLFDESLINKYNFKVNQKSIGVKDIGRF